ncbi:hypothetical protein [Synechocystis salina]|nr:hypothetical protein [Synechocystis salina]
MLGSSSRPIFWFGNRYFTDQRGGKITLLDANELTAIAQRQTE